jgi:hypothetical protein
MVDYESLGLPAALAERFRAWQEVFDADTADETFDETGRELARELKRFVGEDVVVYYGGPSDSEEIRDRAD